MSDPASRRPLPGRVIPSVAFVAALLGISEAKGRMNQRINLAATDKIPCRWSAAALVLAAGLGIAPPFSRADDGFPPFMIEASITSQYFRPNPTNTALVTPEQPTQAEVTFYSSNGWWQVEVKNLNPHGSLTYVQNSMKLPDGVREFTLFVGNTNGGMTTAAVYPIAFPTTGDSRRLLAWLSFCPNPPLPVIDSKKMHRFLYVPGGSIALEMLHHPQNEGCFSARYLQPGGLFLSELNVTNNGVSVDMTMDKGGDWEPEVRRYSAPWDKGFLCFRYAVLATTNCNGIAFPLRTVIKHTCPTWNQKMPDDLYAAGVLELVVKRISFAAGDLANRKPAPSTLLASDYRPPNLPKHESISYLVTNDVWQSLSDTNNPDLARRLQWHRNSNSGR